MYRVKSNAVWHSLPGVVAAYQPIAAPDPFAARQNVAHNGARFGVYTATPGVAPPWSTATGWTFGGTQYLETGVAPVGSWSIFARVSNGPTAGNSCPIGVNPSDIILFYTGAVFSSRYYASGNQYTPGAAVASGVFATAGQQGYLNGTVDGSAISGGGWTNATGKTLTIGKLGNNVSNYYYTGNIRAVLIASRTLSPAEVWLASRQMAYCDVNPDWNAWARRRRYYYAPSAAAIFQPAWARNANTVINQVHP